MPVGRVPGRQPLKVPDAIDIPQLREPVKPAPLHPCHFQETGQYITLPPPDAAEGQMITLKPKGWMCKSSIQKAGHNAKGRDLT